MDATLPSPPGALSRGRTGPHARPSEDRRGEFRLGAPPLFVSGLTARVADVSPGGVGLVDVTEYVRVGDVLEVIVTEGLSFHTKTLGAEVKWIRGDRVGLQWRIDDSVDRAWLEHQFRLWRREGMDVNPWLR